MNKHFIDIYVTEIFNFKKSKFIFSKLALKVSHVKLWHYSNLASLRVLLGDIKIQNQ